MYVFLNLRVITIAGAVFAIDNINQAINSLLKIWQQTSTYKRQHVCCRLLMYLTRETYCYYFIRSLKGKPDQKTFSVTNVDLERRIFKRAKTAY
jgi:hypothetical protein